ncbi:MAG: TOBE domain-containing protein, partial [Eubacteriales bacterium]|nr:TOBE domain-containing protein [Eubacteriales bacterium]
TIRLPASKYNKPEVRAYCGKDIICGVRPEALSDDPEEVAKQEANQATIDAVVEVVERLGAETYLYLSLEDRSLTARVDPILSKSQVHQMATIAIDVSRVVLFDKESEDTIVS